MSEEQLEQIERRLLEERGRSISRIELLRDQAEDTTPADSGELTQYPMHLADVGTEEEIRQEALALAEHESRHFDSIEAALERMYRAPDRFGYCESCGGGIHFERLMQVPHTRFCIECKLRIESGWPDSAKGAEAQ